MKFTLIVLSSLTVANAESHSAALRRRLSFEKVAGYDPGSQVTDHCAIDLDQSAMEAELAKATNESFENAMKIYKDGGHSKSFAQVTLSPALTTPVAKGAPIFGRDASGTEVSGKAYAAYEAGATSIRVQYTTTDIQSDYVNCQVGALVSEINTDGCFVDNGTVTIEGTEYAHTYNPAVDNNNGRTIAGFSTGALEKMRTDCPGCPYTDFTYFYNYYGTDYYADEWVTAALEGEATSFTNGNADFSTYGFSGRAEAVKKGTAYMNIFMYVIREFEDALDDCKRECINCNDDPVHAWDEGVCFYTGSLEGQDGVASGKLLHQLADKRCVNFKTCGLEGDALDGTAAINYELFDLFSLGNFQLQSGNCPAARETTKLITELMYVPLIQGTLRYAFIVDMLQGEEKAKAEGAVFAASVLPRVHDANADAAITIYNNMKVGAGSTSFSDVKAAFESVYPRLGINCKDVGGLWNSAVDDYHEGMEPCVDASTIIGTEEDKTLATILGVTFGSLFILTVLVVCYMGKKEKQGAPVFAPASEEGKPKGVQ